MLLHLRPYGIIADDVRVHRRWIQTVGEKLGAYNPADIWKHNRMLGNGIPDGPVHTGMIVSRNQGPIKVWDLRTNQCRMLPGDLIHQKTAAENIVVPGCDAPCGIYRCQKIATFEPRVACNVW